jgi:Flp pilus assembly protein TadB
MPETTESKCPECGASLKRAAPRCWMCGRGRTEEKIHTLASADQSDENTGNSQPPVFRFSMASLLLLMTLLVVLVGVATMSMGFAIVAAVVILPALLRTSMNVQRRQRSGGKMPIEDRLLLFFSSMLLVVVVGLAATVTFFVTCIATGVAAYETVGGWYRAAESWPFYLAVTVAGLVTLCLLIRLCRRLFWTRTRR